MSVLPKKTIDAEFREKLERFFDTDFVQTIEYLKNAVAVFLRESSTLRNLLLKIEKNEENNVQTKLDLNAFKTARLALEQLLTQNDGRVKEKLAEPSRAVKLFPIDNAFDSMSKLIDKANAEIEKWNQIVVNYAEEKANLVNDIWSLIVIENRPMIEAFQKKFLGIEKKISNISSECETLRNQYRELETKIKNANKNVTSVQPTIDEINYILSMYGFSGFTIVPTKDDSNQYQIQRSDKSLAETTLSEGEITFLTFLYFLQLAKGSQDKENISDNRILVIDDPISSLDSSVLFVVSSLIKESMKNIKAKAGNIKQLILLTHNVYFHKEVSFMNGKSKESRDINFWILRKHYNISSVQEYETKNPIKNSYELLWQELRYLDNIQSCITIQNIMRRIIEEYFKTLGGYTNDTLLNKFTIPEEKEICRALISWINDGSHCIADSLFVEHSTETIQKYHNIFKRIFTETNHDAHYNMMMRISD
ncbi:MAG: AAA family ATPase [Evtepia sp.]